MPTTVQFRRGTTQQHSSFTGSNAEITVDSDKNTLVVHDGSTAGGHPLEKELTSQRIVDVLGYTPQNSAAAISNVELNNLSDVSYSNPEVGQALIWNGTKFTLDTPFNSDAFIIELSKVTTDNLPESSSRKYLTLSNLKSELGNTTTTDLPEGTNLYYTNTRVQEYLTLNNYVTTNSLTTLENNLVNSAPSQLNTLGELAGAINNDPSFHTTISNALNTKANVSDLEDIATDASSDNITEGGTNLFFTNARARDAIFQGTGVTYSSDTGQISIGQDVSTTASVVFNTVTATNINSNVTGDVTGSLSGNASTATALDNARTFAITGDIIASGIAFDGTSNVLLEAIIQPNSVELGTQTTGPYASLISVSGNGLSITPSNPDDATSYVITSNATASNTGNTIVYRDASGNFAAETITANLVGNVTGNVTGNVQGDLTGDVTGNVTGQVSSISNHTTDGLIEGDNNLYYSETLFNSSLSNKTTDNLVEGNNNLYYTTDRFDARLATKSTTDISEGSNLYYTDDRVDAVIASKTTDDISEGSSNLYYTSGRFTSDLNTKTTDDLTEGTTNKYFATSLVDEHLSGGTGVTYSSGEISIGQDISNSAQPTFAGLTVDGNLTVNGATTVISSNQVNIGDNIIELNSDIPEDQSPTQDAGFTVNRGSEESVRLVWDESNDRFTVGTHSFVANEFIGNVTGQVSDLSNHSADDLVEGTTNKYFTDDNFDENFGQKTTADVIEDPDATPTTGTMFFTNSRAREAISVSGYGTYNSVTGNITISGPVTSVNSKMGDVALTADDIPNGSTNRYFSTSNFDSAFNGKRTSDLQEEGNLYFTQARARESISVEGAGSYNSITGTITIVGAVESVNTKIGPVVLTTADIPEDPTSPNNRLYYTQERVEASVDDALLTRSTDNLPAGVQPDRQYFSNELARDAFTFTGPRVTYDQVTGDVSIGAAITSINDDNGGDDGVVVLSTDDINEGELSLESGGNKFFTNARARAAINITGEGGTYNQSTGEINITGAVSSVNTAVGDVVLKTTDIPEDSDNPNTNIYFTEDRVYSVLNKVGEEYATQVFVTNRLGANLDLSQVTTDDLPESQTSYAEGGKKYFDNALARAAISLHPDTDGATYDSDTGVLLVTGAVSSVNGLTGDVSLTTADISESPGIKYYTDGYVQDYLDSIGISGGVAGQSVVSIGNGQFDLRDISLTRVSETAPTDVVEGELWFDSNDGILKIYYDNFWVAINDFVFNVTQDDILAAIGYEPNIVVQEPVVKAVQDGYLNLIGTNDFNWTQDQVFYINGLDGDITVNITNVPGSSSPIQIDVQFMISQKETAYIPEALQIDGIVKQIKWIGGSQPTGNNSNVDLFTFTMLYDGSDWIQVLGKLESYS